MNRNLDFTPAPRRPVLALALALATATGALAQEPDTSPLIALLGQLQRTGAEIWQARAAAMQSAAAAAVAEAKALRERAQTADASAVAEDEAGKRLAAEVEKITELRALLAQLGFRDPAGEKAAEPDARGHLERAIASLRQLPNTAWDARATAMRDAAAGHDRLAVEHRKAGGELRAQAEAKDGTARALEAELGKLDQLQKLVASLAPESLTAAVAKTPQPAPERTPAASAQQPEGAPAKVATPPEGGKDGDGEDDADLVTYDDHVLPIFEANCLDCHGNDDPSSGLDLSTYATTMLGGSSGRTLRPGNPDESRLYLLVAHKETPPMPKDAPRLGQPLIDTIHDWIRQGAAKDAKQAKKLTADRAAARAKAMAAAAARELDRFEVKAVMPEGLAATRKSYPQRPGAMRAIAASPGAPLLAAPGFHQVLLLHQDELRELGVLDFPFGQVEALTFSADGTTLLAAGGIAAQQGGAVLYDVRTGSELGRFGEQRDVVLSAAVSPRAELVAIGSTRRMIEVVRVEDGRPLWQQKHDDWVTSTAFSADGKLLASADRQGFVQVREAWNGREVHAMKVADGTLAALSFSPDSTLLATADADRGVSLYRMSDGNRLFRQQSHGDQVLCLTFSSPTRLLTSGADGRILHWQTNGRLEPELPRIDEWVYGIAASADGKRVFTVDWQGRLSAIDSPARKLLGQATPLAVTQ
ncbi:MAG: hypothetical protein KDC98_16890 [Planctomycetes bacterium]|nr:hypothetical protein [Planctomycetota bacterium]